MNKYRACKQEIDGYIFDSKAEARRYQELKYLSSAGAIACLEIHPRFILQEGFTSKSGKERAIWYEADFSYVIPLDLSLIVEDVKGIQTPVFKLKRKLLLFRWPEIDFRMVKA